MATPKKPTQTIIVRKSAYRHVDSPPGPGTGTWRKHKGKVVRLETIEEYLARGGVIQRVPHPSETEGESNG